MTQLEAARKGRITDEMQFIARDEKIPPETLREWVAEGRVVIPANVKRTNRCPRGIGEPLRVKINTNLGTSPNNCLIENELDKLKAAEEPSERGRRYGAERPDPDAEAGGMQEGCPARAHQEDLRKGGSDQHGNGEVDHRRMELPQPGNQLR